MNRISIGIVFLGVSVLLGLTFVPSVVHASTLSESYSVTTLTESTDWTQTLSIPQFNPSLGTLTSVEVESSGSLSTALLVGNISGSFGLPANSSNGTADTQSTFTITPSGSVNLVLSPLSVMAEGSFGPLVSGGTQNLSSVPMGTASNSNTYTAQAALNYFTGSGSLSWTASTSTETGITYSGGVTYAYATDPNATLNETVIYTYNTVPEPSALAILGTGLLGVVVYRWRKRRA
jgi:hypothetical protein